MREEAREVARGEAMQAAMLGEMLGEMLGAMLGAMLGEVGVGRLCPGSTALAPPVAAPPHRTLSPMILRVVSWCRLPHCALHRPS